MSRLEGVIWLTFFKKVTSDVTATRRNIKYYLKKSIIRALNLPHDFFFYDNIFINKPCRKGGTSFTILLMLSRYICMTSYYLLFFIMLHLYSMTLVLIYNHLYKLHILHKFPFSSHFHLFHFPPSPLSFLAPPYKQNCNKQVYKKPLFNFFMLIPLIGSMMFDKHN